MSTIGLACLVVSCAADAESEAVSTEEAPLVCSAPLVYPAPKKGARVVVVAQPKLLSCALRVTERSYDFPAGAIDPEVSITGKGMCFSDGTTIHCHVSGTGTGFCRDELNNVANLVHVPSTIDGNFVIAYARKRPALRLDISGHSQGAYDAGRIAPRLRQDDQLVLLQPASSAVLPNTALLDAIGRGARVIIGWSPNDNASLGIRPLAGRVPLLTFPYQTGIRVHNAPNARDQLLRWFDVEEGFTTNPALDASIISNPGSPHDPAWRFPEWAP